jgi:hypothetical protein
MPSRRAPEAHRKKSHTLRTPFEEKAYGRRDETDFQELRHIQEISGKFGK